MFVWTLTLVPFSRSVQIAAFLRVRQLAITQPFPTIEDAFKVSTP